MDILYKLSCKINSASFDTYDISKYMENFCKENKINFGTHKF